MVKYHGDFRVPGSMVLTETSYFQRLLDVNATDILFAGDALFYDFLFLGYGFGDISLKYTIQQLERITETFRNKEKPEVYSFRKPEFYILRTDNKFQNDYQDTAYSLRSIDMADSLQNFTSPDGLRFLESFSDKKNEPRKVSLNENQSVFSSFSSLWSAAEFREDKPTYCERAAGECKDGTCEKVHLSESLIGKENYVTATAKRFRAEVLMEGFTKFLTKLVEIQ